MKAHFPDPSLPPAVIVDDCEDDILLFRHRLREGGMTNPIVTCHSVPAALTYLGGVSEFELRPHLLFTDIKMPDQGGLELISWIRSDPRWDEMKVVVVTSSNHPADMQTALALRVDGYLIKFPPTHILAEFLEHGPWFSTLRPAAPLVHAPSA